MVFIRTRFHACRLRLRERSDERLASHAHDVIHIPGGLYSVLLGEHRHNPGHSCSFRLAVCWNRLHLSFQLLPSLIVVLNSIFPPK